MEKKILIWLFTGETGISSKCIAATMCGIKPKDNYTPSDPSDFCRCLKLLRAVPEIRTRLHEMRCVSDLWDKLISRWGELEAQFMQEVPGWLDGKDYEVRAEKTYKLMKEIGI